ncbi:hypothetical protein ACHAPT_006271 [Fusarium lateritium]
MSRVRKNRGPKKRRRDRKFRELLRAHIAAQDAQAGDTGQDAAEPTATAQPSGKDTTAPEAASAAGQKTEPKQRPKSRGLPDRYYYDHPEKMERRFRGIQHRLTSLLDDKIAKGSTALKQWKRDASDYMKKLNRQLEHRVDEMERRHERTRRHFMHRADLQEESRAYHMRRFAELQKRHWELADLVEPLSVSVSTLQEKSEKLDESLSKLEKKHEKLVKKHDKLADRLEESLASLQEKRDNLAESLSRLERKHNRLTERVEQELV